MWRSLYSTMPRLRRSDCGVSRGQVDRKRRKVGLATPAESRSGWGRGTGHRRSSSAPAAASVVWGSRGSCCSRSPGARRWAGIPSAALAAGAAMAEQGPLALARLINAEHVRIGLSRSASSLSTRPKIRRTNVGDPIGGRRRPPPVPPGSRPLSRTTGSIDRTASRNTGKASRSRRIARRPADCCRASKTIWPRPGR